MAPGRSTPQTDAPAPGATAPGRSVPQTDAPAPVPAAGPRGWEEWKKARAAGLPHYSTAPASTHSEANSRLAKCQEAERAKAEAQRRGLTVHQLLWLAARVWRELGYRWP